MAQEIGESRDKWGMDVWNAAEDFASKVKADKPFYVVYAAKADRGMNNTFRQTFRAYFHRPQALIGLLVWYVDKVQGLFNLVPELSIPPDVPLDPMLMSKDGKDTSTNLAEVGKQMGILLA